MTCSKVLPVLIAMRLASFSWASVSSATWLGWGGWRDMCSASKGLRKAGTYVSLVADALWAAAGFDDTLLRWQMKPEVVNGEKKDIQSRVQTRGGQTGR